MVTNGDLEGRSLDSAMQNDSRLWYPRVWPSVDEGVDEKLDEIADSILDEAKTQARSEFFELVSIFSKNSQNS